MSDHEIDIENLPSPPNTLVLTNHQSQNQKEVNSSTDFLNQMIKHLPNNILIESLPYINNLNISPSIETLYYAIEKGNLFLVKKILLVKDLVLNSRKDPHSSSPLELAVKLVRPSHPRVIENQNNEPSIKDRINIINILLNSGADPNYGAIREGSLFNEYISPFIELMIDSNRKQIEFSPIVQEILEVLFRYGLKLNLKVLDNKTLLEYWYITYLKNLKWDFMQQDDFYYVLELMIKNNQQMDVCDLDNQFMKSVSKELKTDSRWYSSIIRLYQRFKIVETKNQITNQDYLCSICRDNNRTIIYLPCKHLATCYDCDHKIKKDLKCPICRSIVEDSIEIYLA